MGLCSHLSNPIPQKSGHQSLRWINKLKIPVPTVGTSPAEIENSTRAEIKSSWSPMNFAMPGKGNKKEIESYSLAVDRCITVFPLRWQSRGILVIVDNESRQICKAIPLVEV
ncbi:hypothetical protein CISG_02335 [Coccidioides immitis RMSCC 3703]|uniref:Uncharacterized protein n=1 Tax=Coccidioides immitis RMSCC 3703 TaxID=454286 RepID=A0A0J8R5W4_COCIT|nr:hypothetical protein CISG_02335 [Coccidioides immitis RMSCC 3703]